MPEFRTPWNRPERRFEKNDGKSITEEAGSIPFPEQVRLAIAQGEINARWRAKHFDAVDEKDNLDDFDPIPYKEDGIDLADRRKAVAARLRAAKEEFEKAQEAEKQLQADPEAADEPNDQEPPENAPEKAGAVSKGKK